VFGVLACATSCGFPRPSPLGDDAGGNVAIDGALGLDATADALALDAALPDVLMPDAFVAPPLVTAFSPSWGSTSGGTRVRVLGFGFTGPGLAVKFGSAVASNVTVVSDTELTLTTPVGPHAPVELSITTQGGTVLASSRYRYLAPLYAADARGSTPGNLYIINPTNAASVTVGALGVAVTGMALSPDGVLYGATVAKMPATSSLVTIDPYTARVATIGSLITTNGAATSSPDLAFAGTTLYGWDKSNLSTINVTTGRVTVHGLGGPSSVSLASSDPGTLLVIETAKLSVVNIKNETLSAGPALSRTFGTDSLTYVGGVLYAAETTSATPHAASLVTINPVNGAMTVIGTLPPNVDAIEGIPAATTQAAAVPSPPQFELAKQEFRPFESNAEPSLSIANQSVPLRDLIARGHDVGPSGRTRRIVPIAALANFGIGDRATFVSRNGDTYSVARSAQGLALVASHRHGLKLVDLRGGFQRVFGEIAEIR